MRSLTRLPFAADLEVLFTERVTEYTKGRAVLTPTDIGEVAWGVSTLWEGFTGKRELAGVDYLARPELLHAYLLYYLPRSYVQARLVFGHLDPTRIRRVLDLGSGPGPLVRAAVDAFGGPNAKLDLVAVDHDARALEVAKRVVGKGLRTHVAKLPALPPAVATETFDLVSLGLVVNELFAGQHPLATLRARWLVDQVWPRVAPGGYLVIIEPALKETGREILLVRDLLVTAGLRVIAPCVRQGGCPALLKERDWCHAGIRFQPPNALNAIGKGVGIDATDLRYSYLVFEKDLSPDPSPKGGGESSPGDRASASLQPTSEELPPPSLGEGSGERSARTNVPETFRVVSDPMVEKGRLKLWICGERGRVLLDRQDKHRTEANQAFDDLVRDDLVTVAGAEEKAESLRVAAETKVIKVLGNA